MEVPCYPLDRNEMFRQVDCHQSMNNLVEDDQSDVGSTLQETAPTKICKHGCHASLPAVVTADIPGPSPLYHFQLVLVGFCKWVPDSSSVFNLGVNQR